MKTEFPTIYMPDTGKPAPPILTRQELAAILRIDPDRIARTLQTVRKNCPHVLRGIQVGKRVHFDLREVWPLIDAIKTANPK